MANFHVSGSPDDPPPSSIQRRDQRAFRTICEILRTHFELSISAATLDSRLIEDLGLDLFDLPDLILDLEKTFERDIPLSVAARILTLRDAVSCVLCRQ
jgi:acyl carrier protein